MKKAETANKKDLLESKMTLRDYFQSLPDAKQIAPKKQLTERVAMRCKVPFSTARSWLVYGIKPRDPGVLTVLSEETGIPVENLFHN